MDLFDARLAGVDTSKELLRPSTADLVRRLRVAATETDTLETIPASFRAYIRESLAAYWSNASAYARARTDYRELKRHSELCTFPLSLYTICLPTFQFSETFTKERHATDIAQLNDEVNDAVKAAKTAILESLLSTTRAEVAFYAERIDVEVSVAAVRERVKDRLVELRKRFGYIMDSNEARVYARYEWDADAVCAVMAHVFERALELVAEAEDAKLAEAVAQMDLNGDAMGQARQSGAAKAESKSLVDYLKRHGYISKGVSGGKTKAVKKHKNKKKPVKNKKPAKATAKPAKPPKKVAVQNAANKSQKKQKNNATKKKKKKN